VLDAKKEAEALLTEAGEWIEGRIKTASEAAFKAMLAELHQEMQTIERIRIGVVRAAWAMATICLIGISGIVGITLASLQ
jgi:hypothetical protein